MKRVEEKGNLSMSRERWWKISMRFLMNPHIAICVTEGRDVYLHAYVKTHDECIKHPIYSVNDRLGSVMIMKCVDMV